MGALNCCLSQNYQNRITPSSIDAELKSKALAATFNVTEIDVFWKKVYSLGYKSREKNEHV